MLKRTALVLICALGAFGQTPEKEVSGVVQKLFDAMEAKDGAAIRALFTPGAPIISSRSGKVSSSTVEEFVTRISGITDGLKERIWDPTIKVEGNVAMLWAPYDFHRGGKFDHCGVDIANLVKTEAGWKLASLTFSSETQGCVPSPLGPLK